MPFLWTSWVSVVVLMMYFWTFFVVGKARGKHGVKAPSVDGPDDFLCALRVQSNTVEQLVFFGPAMWLCAMWLSDHFAAIFGAIWVAGRIVYAISYLKDPKTRGPGFVISMLASVVLLLGAVVGLTGLIH
ncbi:MAPEG family protein [Undibacterium sp. MH2W]|uniref:MAPEG family protein n=1 Tax=Undibacterium sp. MH2W TaxID=3413044 RepID=UPI003BF392CD